MKAGSNHDPRLLYTKQGEQGAKDHTSGKSCSNLR